LPPTASAGDAVDFTSQNYSVCEVLTFSAYRRSPRWRPRTSRRAHQFAESRCLRPISATFRKMQGRWWLSRARVTSGS